MKNKSKVLSLVMALVMCAVMSVPSFADNSTDSPGNITSEVMLTTAGTAFSVTVPTQLPINIALDGTVTTATNVAIVNDSSGPVVVTNVSVNVKNGWTLAEWGKDFSATQIGVKEFTMQLNGANVSTDGSVALTGFPSIASGDSLPLTYDADLATQVNAINEGIADVVFTVGWDTSGETPSEPDDPDPNDPEPDNPEEKPVAYAYVDSETHTMYFDRAASLEEVPEGAYTGFETGAASWRSDASIRSEVTSIMFRDTIHPINTTYWFSSFAALTTVENSNRLDTSNVTSMYSMFSGCSELATLDVSDWNTSNVTNMYSMFSGCSELATLDVSDWNTSNVTNMYGVYNGCCELATLDVSDWDTSNVTNMGNMFCGCIALTTLDVSDWNTGNVTSMDYMFERCSRLTTLDLSDWDTSNVTTMSSMFNGCSALTTLGVSGWDTSNVTNMNSMFNGCSALTTLDVSGWDTSNVTNMNSMFSGCRALTTLDVSDWNTSNVTNMGYMFSYCSALTTIYTGDLFQTNTVTQSKFMFSSCTNLVGGNGTTYDSNYTNKTYARIDTAETPGYFTLTA